MEITNKRLRVVKKLDTKLLQQVLCALFTLTLCYIILWFCQSVGLIKQIPSSTTFTICSLNSPTMVGHLVMVVGLQAPKTIKFLKSVSEEANKSPRTLY